MLTSSLNDLDWIPYRQWLSQTGATQKEVAAILGATGSLTRFLQRRFHLQLELEVKEQFFDNCRPWEARLLDVAEGAACLRRLVALRALGKVMFDAESILPLEGLPTDLMRSLQEGREPLGNLLFDRGLSLSRSDLSVASWVPEGSRYPVWARRSVLRSAGGPRALVIEIFHSAFWRIIRRHAIR